MKIRTLMISFAALCMSGASAQTTTHGLDKSNMDLSVKPGTDFYEFSGGGWMKAHPLTAEFSRYGQFTLLDEENNERIRTLIEELGAKQQPQGSLEQKIGSLYRLSMDSARCNREGFEPIKSRLERVRNIQNLREYQMVGAQLEREGIGALMFGMGVEADLKNASQNLVQIGQGGLSMSDRDYYLNDDEATVKIREAYKKYVQRLFELVGYNANEAASKRDAVLDLETQIARENYSRTKLRDVEGNYHKMTYAQLLADYPGIDWSTIQLCLGVPFVEELSVGQPEPIHNVENILANTPLDKLKTYMEWKVINGAAGLLSDDFREASFDFYSRTMSGQQEERPLWKRSVSRVNRTLGMAVGKMYVEKYFPESSKQKMLELVENLRKAFGQRIASATWMSAETKKQAQEKLDAFYVKIGYPDEWKDYSGLQIDESLSLYENMRRASRFFNDDEIARKVNKPVDKKEWFMTPQTINAYYNPTTNEICFPAGILQAPFFDPDADDAVNYGAIGVVIGHEMTHGFDDQGSQFDKDGNLKNWWTADDKKNFDARTKVMENFFNGIEVLPGLKANGALTLGENIADNGGLNISFQALQNVLKAKPQGKIDGYTPEQRFFISYGLIWAQNIRDEQVRVYTKTDPHSMGRWRVNGALPQIDAWYDAFGITKKAPLFLQKDKRVRVW